MTASAQPSSYTRQTLAPPSPLVLVALAGVGAILILLLSEAIVQSTKADPSVVPAYMLSGDVFRWALAKPYVCWTGGASIAAVLHLGLWLRADRLGGTAVVTPEGLRFTKQYDAVDLAWSDVAGYDESDSVVHVRVAGDLPMGRWVRWTTTIPVARGTPERAAVLERLEAALRR